MVGLSGMKQICLHCNRSESTILAWIRERDFPAAKITGSWESDTERIDKWRKKQIDDAITSQIMPQRAKIKTMSTLKTRKNQ
jgi:predicted DNA-binding transcriptional regulator AlpA